MKKLDRYKTFIFDLDNTLYDYSFCDKIAYNHAANLVSDKFNLLYNEALDIISQGKINAKSLLDNSRSSSHNRFLYFQKTAELLNSNNVIDDTFEMYKVYNESFYKAMQPYNWVIEFFKTHQCCVCTNMIAEIQFKKLTILGISKYVKLIVTSEEADIEKPNDDIYILLYNKLKNSNVDISNCLFIGDNLDHDVQGPKSFGFDSMHVDEFTNILKMEN